MVFPMTRQEKLKSYRLAQESQVMKVPSSVYIGLVFAAMKFAHVNLENTKLYNTMNENDCIYEYSTTPYSIWVSAPRRVLTEEGKVTTAIFFTATSMWCDNEGHVERKKGYVEWDEEMVDGTYDKDPVYQALEKNKYLEVKKVL